MISAAARGMRYAPPLMVVAAALILLLAAGCSAAAVPFVMEASIPLGDVAGRIDHLTFDPTRGHIAVAELGNDSVAVVNLETRSVIERITGLDDPQGIAYVTSTDLIAVANGGDGSLRFYRGSDFSEAGRIDLGNDADNVHVIANSSRVLIGYGAGAVAIVDTQSMRVASSVSLPAHPEGLRLSADGRHVYVNVPGAEQIAVVDIVAGEQSDSFTFAGLGANFPMAVSRNGTELASVFRTPARLGLIDLQTGTLRWSHATCSDADDVFFDSRRGRIYVSCGEGAVDVFERTDGGYRELGRTQTATGARTALFVPELDRLYVAAPATPRHTAELLVLRP
jgi:YVTN family beta-propeller protein